MTWRSSTSSKLAPSEIERLAEWWSVNRTAAPGHVRLDVEGVLFVITRNPRLGQKVENARSVEVRRYLMSRTQHWLYFRVKNNVLEILAVWSTSRGEIQKSESLRGAA